jgi:tetratricopeptide (TPR) repeat protein
MNTPMSHQPPCARRSTRSFSAALLLFFFVTTAVIAPNQSRAATDPSLVATIYSLEGTVELRRRGESKWQPITHEAKLFVGDTVKSGADGAVAFSFVDGTLVRLGGLSAITFKEVLPSGSPVVSQSSGRGYYFSRGAKHEPEIRTPLVNAAIYGTELVVDVDDKTTTIDVLHGAIRASNPQGELVINSGERVTARPAVPLEKTILAKSSNSVQWMVRFPFLLREEDFLSAELDCNISCQAEAKNVIQKAQSGQTLYSALQQAKPSLTKTTTGQLLLALAIWRTGDAAKARTVLAKLDTTAHPRLSALALTLEGFDAFVGGNSELAANFLRRARAKDSSLLNSELLQSYIEQAQGDPEAALQVISEARTRHPGVPEFMDREAELLLALEEPRKAEKIITQRVTTFGQSPTAVTLQGFAAVQRKNFDDAARFFEQAVQADSSRSLPYLGQALVRVRDRDYAAAQALLSKAVQLDPSVATYRSYLGKLFFENEDTPNALREFEAAVALDPNDPSPHLYRSFAHVANNDPVAALDDVERSIELNDSRAVYRSRLLLDRDLAVRGAGLSRVFSELGFSDAARIEAIRSITDDYTNFSAHRLLSDSYQSAIDAEANLTEQRIADLLAPLSFNLFNSLGELATLDDYNALFDKKETRQAVRVDYNSNHDQFGGELLSVGRTDRSGYLLSYRPFYMSGSRHKRFAGENDFRVALQHEFTEDDRLILDGSFRMLDSEGPTDNDYSENVHIGLMRVGYNHRVSSSLRFLVQGEYGRDRERSAELLDRSVDFDIPGESELFTTDTETRESSRQVVNRTGLSTQMIYSSRYLDSITGLEGKYADTSRREYSPVFGFPAFPEADVTGALTSSSKGSLKSAQAYEYLSFKLPTLANFTAGLAATSVEHDLTEIAPFQSGENLETAITPKFGLVLTPTSWLTTRTAYFESLSNKSVLEDLTSLEPTLVGGISQRYTDLSGAYSRNIGVGIDVKEPNSVYAGAQYLRRNLRETIGSVDDIATYDGETISSLTPSSDGFFDTFAESDTVRGYLSLITSRNSSLTGDALSNLYRETDPAIDSSIRTDRFRLGYRYFLGKHLSFNTQAIYRDQATNQFDDPSGFWLFDAGVSYRFAEQRGRMFLRVDNLLDRSFTYDQNVGLEAPILEGRSVVVGFSYNFW